MTGGFAPAGAVLELPLAVRQHLRSTALAERPEEACGLLVGSPGSVGEPRTRVARAVALPNGATAAVRRHRYRIEAEDYLEVDRAARAEGLEVVGIWHSHPGGSAEPSLTDVAWAWPAFSYLIVGADDCGTARLRSWRWRAGELLEERLVP